MRLDIGSALDCAASVIKRNLTPVIQTNPCYNCCLRGDEGERLFLPVNV